MEAPTTISVLPFECVERIFNIVDENDLSAASLVCHEFLHLASNRVQELELWYETIPHLNFFSKLLQRLRNLKRLTLHCPTEFDLAGTLDRIADLGLDLEFLSLIPDNIFDQIDPYFPRQSLIRIISSNMPNLRSNSSTYLTRDDYELIALAEIFPELEDLDLSYCGDVSEQGIEKALKRFRKLRRINLSYNEDHLSNAWLFSLANCPLLEDVECIFSDRLTDIGVCALLRGCPKLRYVVLGGILLDMINFPIFSAVVCKAKNLRYLRINGVTMVDRYCDDGELVSAAQIKKAFVSGSGWQLYGY